MREEFYIDGNLLERETGASPAALVFQSTLLSDIDSIVSNRSNSIDFPRTAKNLASISNADIEDGTFPYVKHNAQYKREGISIFTGYAQLLKLTDKKMTFVFVWGNIKAFQSLLNMRLRSMDNSLKKTWTKQSASSQTGYFDLNTDWGLGHFYPDTGNEQYAPHPFLKVTDIMSKAAQLSGVTFQNQNKFSDLLIPMVTRNAIPGTATLAVEFEKGSLYADGLLGFNSQWDTDFDNWVNSQYNFGTGGVTKCRIVFTAIEIVLVDGGSSGIYDVEGEISIEDGERPHNVIDSSTEDIYDINYEQVSGGTKGIFTLRSPIVMDDIDISNVNSIQIRLLKNMQLVAWSSISISCFAKIYQYKADGALINIGDDFPLYHNLPDWTMAQLIRNVMKIKGAFPVPLNSNSISFLTISDLKNRKSSAPDWTSKVPNLPTEVGFSYGDTARRNVFKYQNDEEGNEYEGDMNFNNEFLAESKDLVNIEFSGTKMQQGKPFIPLYSLNDDNELEFNDSANPRILAFTESAQGVTSGFVLIAPDNIIENEYADYKALLENPRVLTVSAYLDAVDLAQLDLYTPVYLQQTGRYYLIGSLTTQDKSKCKVELIEI